MDKIKESAKAVASLVASVCVAVIAVGVDGTTGKALAIVAAVAGAVVTWAVPNQATVNPVDPDPTPAKDEWDHLDDEVA